MSEYLRNHDDLSVKSFKPAGAGAPSAAEEPFEGEVTQETPPMGGGPYGMPNNPPMKVPDARPPRAMAPAPQVVAPGFTMVDGDCRMFAKEYAPRMECPNYIGDTNMILKYLFREERRNGITMPIKACGIDPIVFDNVERLMDEDGSALPSNYFSIPDDASESEESNHVYELIEVDGNLYMSCMSECLNAEYLHRIITEATTTMRETGCFIFRMVGLRRLAVDNKDEGVGRLLETLRLNSFEMSTLCLYMQDFEVKPTFEIIDGHQCICFRAQ